METWIFFATIFVSIANGYVDRYNLIHFSKSEDELMKCLEKTNLSVVLNESIDDAQLRWNLLKRISHLLHEVTVPKVNIVAVASDLVGALGVTMIPYNEDKMKRVKKAIVSALHKCSDSKNPKTSQDEDGDIEPPRFVQETPEIAELLNRILIDWRSIYPYFGENDYLTFSIYSEWSLTLIEIALGIMNNAYELTNELARMWSRRVRLFFDSQSNPEYLLSFYKSYRAVVSTNSFFNFPRRLRNNNTFRDPPVLKRYFVFEMTRYRALDWDNPSSSHEFSVPNTTSMTRSQHHFRFHRHQFFKRLFTYLESVEKGLTDKSGKTEWKAFAKKLQTSPNPSSGDYGAYLETLQRRELTHDFARNSPIFSSLVRSLEPGDRIDEFDLLMMYWHRLRSKDLHVKNELSEDFRAGSSKSRTTTTSTKTTTSYDSTDLSSTSGYDELERGKGPVTRLPSGKYVLKKQRGSLDNKHNPSSSKRCKYSQNSNDVAENYYGYITKRSNPNQPLLSGNNMMSLDLLQNTFSTLLKSELHGVNGLSWYSGCELF